MACLDDNLLFAYVENTLSTEERGRAQQHLDDCTACRRLLSDIARAAPLSLGRPDASSGIAGETSPFANTEIPISAKPPMGMATNRLRAFSDDELIAGRYRVVRFLAHGGMGEVYEAFDLELKEPVALKTVLPVIAADEQALRRFKREILIARKVTHPNVCRIFDVGFHRRVPKGMTEEETVTFLSMELLTGETLTQRLKAQGRMTSAEALPLVRQMADALHAAHQAGIIHRDFKSSNVFLVPQATQQMRVVVTDFGLARSTVKAEDSDAALTGQGAITGTPAYMSPEQVSGSELTAATDIYSLGVVLYELVTGNWPFRGDTPLALATKRLTEPPLSPRQHCPNLEASWESVILRCLEKAPDARFQSTQEVVRALAGEHIAAPSQTALVERKQARPLLGAGVAALSLLLLGAGYTLWRRAQPGNTATAVADKGGARKLRRAVAVLGFQNSSGRTEAGWLSTALSEMFATELAIGEELRTISGEQVARMKRDLSLVESPSYARDTLERIRTYLGVDLLVMGSFVALGKDSGGALRLDLRLQDAATGELLLSAAESGSEAALFHLVSQGGARLRERLGVGQIPAIEVAGARASLPVKPEAARLYAQGLAKLHDWDFLAAQDYLEKALAEEPTHALTHRALAATYESLGFDDKAKEESQKAFELSASLRREDRLQIEALFRRMKSEDDRAREIYRALFELFPDNLEYGLRLADTQRDDATGLLATLARLRQLPPPMQNDPAIDLMEIWAQRLKGDIPAYMSALERAVKEGEARGARFLVASAWAAAGYMHHYLGAFEQAQSDFEKSHRIASALGYRVGMATALSGLASVRERQGDLTGAIESAEAGLRIRRELGNKTDLVWTLADASSPLLLSGKLSVAQQRVDEALSLGRQLGLREATGVALYRQGSVLYQQGQLAPAKRAYDEALAIWKAEVGTPRPALVSSLLGECLLLEGNLVEARQKYEAALPIQDAFKLQPFAADNRRRFAALALEEGRLDEAERLAKEATQEFQREHAPDDAAAAQCILSRVLLKQEKFAEAQSALSRAEERAQKSENLSLRLAVLLTRARVLAAGHPTDFAQALRLATVAEAAATTSGFVPEQLEARLLAYEIERAAGHAIGRVHLQVLAKEARSKGFGLIARKAAAHVE